MTSVEDRVHAAMSAARNLAAQEIPAAPPLHLPSAPASAPADRTSRPHAQHRWVRWVTPLAAAAAVIAVAGTLVLVKGAQNDGTSPASPGTSAGQTAPTGPDGVPRYYAAIQPKSDPSEGKQPYMTTPLVVGDSLTGQKLATITPPAGVTFQYVTAADDDLTFVVSGKDGTGASATIELFEIRLAPGTANPAQMTRLPIAPQPVVSNVKTSASGVTYAFPVALSGSGTEVAVAEFVNPNGTPGSGGMAVKVFSVATGALLHDWTTTDPSLSLNGLAIYPTLTWIDDDQAIALATLGAPTHSGKTYRSWQTVRSLNVNGPASGDLIADSTVLRNVQVGAEYATSGACGYESEWPPVISSDGKTFTCTTGGAFVTYPLTAGATAGGQGTVDLSTGNNDFVSEVLWTSTTGDAVIGEWGVDDGTVQSSSNTKYVQIDVISGGRSTPLHFPPGFRPAFDNKIAW